jgi:hypothetical protein
MSPHGAKIPCTSLSTNEATAQDSIPRSGLQTAEAQMLVTFLDFNDAFAGRALYILLTHDCMLWVTCSGIVEML